jgi:hypothetical protein
MGIASRFAYPQPGHVSIDSRIGMSWVKRHEVLIGGW